MPEGNDTVLGFDYGERRIGVAVGHRLTGLASPLETVTNPRDTINWGALLDLIEQWRPAALVVGIPTHMDGTETAMTARARHFMDTLASRSRLPAHAADERASSRDAENIIKSNRQQGRRRANKGDTDKIAAALILQHWMEANHA